MPPWRCPQLGDICSNHHVPEPAQSVLSQDEVGRCRMPGLALDAIPPLPQLVGIQWCPREAPATLDTTPCLDGMFRLAARGQVPTAQPGPERTVHGQRPTRALPGSRGDHSGRAAE